MWEDIDESSDRLKVPGGWIVRSWLSTNSSNGGRCIHQIFIADTGEEWKLK